MCAKRRSKHTNASAGVAITIGGLGLLADSFRGLGIGIRCALFDGHVLELTGFEDFTTFLTFHEFAVFIARHDLHARMFALVVHAVTQVVGW